MATITARYQGTCAACGGRISVGDQIDYVKGSPVRHAKCQRTEPPKDAIRLSGGSGYGCHGWVPKTVIRSSKDRIAKGGPEWLYVLEASRNYYREDGMSFGVGDEQGYIYSAVCRPATPEEAAPKIAELAVREARAKAAAGLKALWDSIATAGERPDGRHTPEGTVVPIGEGQTIYGGGSWFVVGAEWIWAVRNNGGDGDMWDANNVATGGAGGIGWRVPFTVALAEQIRSIAAVAQRGP